MSSKYNDQARITRMRERFQTEPIVISIERAKLFTEKWFELEKNNISQVRRVALSMKHVYEHMTHYIDDDDMLAGYWTEYFLGVPIDIEKGVFNKVLETELKWSTLFGFRVKALLKSMGFLLKRRQIGHFLKNKKIMSKTDSQPMNLKIKTMEKREINPFHISKNDKKILIKDLLPQWKEKCIVDRLQKEIAESGLLAGDMLEFSKSLPANTSRQTNMISMCATIASIQGHIILDYETVLKKGLLGIKADIEEILAKSEPLSEDQIEFLNSLLIAVDGIIIFSNRLVEALERKIKVEKDPDRMQKLIRMRNNCQNVPLNPPSNFYEAVQSVWTFKTATELAHPMNLHCLGRMDQLLYPFYQHDINSRVITEQEACELLQELLLKLMSQNVRPETNILGNFYHRYLGSTPVTIGGLRPDGDDGTNELTYLFLEAAEKSRAVTNISLRIHQNTPNELLLAVTDTLYRGSSNLSLFNDEINIKSMERRGFSESDARDYAVMGCVEMTCPGKTGAMSANALLLCRLLDITMRNGNSQNLMGIFKNIGLHTGNPDEFPTFEAFLDALFKQADDQIKLLVDVSNLRDKVYKKYLPAPFVSAFIHGCLESKKDVTQGGAKYDLSGISFINSIANLVDSLYVIKKLIYEKQIISFSELIEAIDHNFEEYDEIYHHILKLKGKWGNGFDEVDQLANQVSAHLFEETYNYTNYRGGPFVPYIISMTTHTIDGRISIATPDGRRAATPYAASCNPYNVECNGMTSALTSIASLNYEDVLGCAVNMKFHPTALGKSEENRQKWIDLIRTYFDLGGAQLQPTVVSAEMLHEAQKHPEDYGGLIVKVGGYSAYFTDLGIEIQNEVIARTEHN